MSRSQTCKDRQNLFVNLFGERQTDRLWKLTIKYAFQLCFISDVDLYPKDRVMMVKVNGVEIPINNLPYHHPAGFLF